MDLFIETLTGTAFELRVSPFETIMSIKTKIQRLEGKALKLKPLLGPRPNLKTTVGQKIGRQLPSGKLPRELLVVILGFSFDSYGIFRV